ncbi:acyltransferase family protein, partial [Streptococcus danieliae]|nr:acyltransferase family protein [Streptococcus danieliae]
YTSKEELLSIITKHESIIISGWFLQGIIVMYLTFYLSFRFIKSIHIAPFLNLFLVCLVISIMMYLEIGYWEYNSLLAFPLGIFWGIYKDDLDNIINDKYKFLLILFTILIYLGHNYIDILMTFEIKDNIYNYGFIANIKNIIFVIFFILLTLKLNFKNKIFNFIGNISLELYLIHGMFIYFLPDILGKDNKDDFIYACLVIILSIISAYILNKIINNIQKIRS